VPFTRMRDIQKQLNQLNIDLKQCMDECREIYAKQIERLSRERDTAIVAASQMDDPNNISAQLPPGVEISNKKVFLMFSILFSLIICKYHEGSFGLNLLLDSFLAHNITASP
jgi:hypothetical protein